MRSTAERPRSLPAADTCAELGIALETGVAVGRDEETRTMDSLTKNQSDKRGVHPTLSLADRVTQLAEDVLMKNHRASHDVREAVAILARELTATAEKLKGSVVVAIGARDEAALQAHLALLDAHDRLELMSEVVRIALAGAERSSTFLGETARVKLALARMDASDLLEEKRRLLREEQRRFEQRTEAAYRKVEERIHAMRTKP
jgi:hypothetical protein